MPGRRLPHRSTLIIVEQGHMELDPTVKSMSKMHKWRDSDYQAYKYWEAVQGIKDNLSKDEVKKAIEKHTGRPVNKNTDKPQTKFQRLWGVVEGDKPTGGITQGM